MDLSDDDIKTLKRLASMFSGGGNAPAPAPQPPDGGTDATVTGQVQCLLTALSSDGSQQPLKQDPQKPGALASPLSDALNSIAGSLAAVVGISSAAPTGPAGGDLSGTYPNPNVLLLGHVAPVAAGVGSSAANNGTAVGTGALGDNFGAAVGKDAVANISDSVAVGHAANGTGAAGGGTAVGSGAAGGDNGVAIGRVSSAVGTGNVSIGVNATITAGWQDTCELGGGAAALNGGLSFRGKLLVDYNAGSPKLGALDASALIYGNAASTGTGYTSNKLTDGAYEEGTLVTTLNNMGSGTPSITLKCVRRGAMITVQMTSSPSATKTQTSNPTIADALPAAFRPAQQVAFLVLITNNGVSAVGEVTISSAGVIQWFPNVSGGAWTASGICALTATAFCYTAN